MVEYRDETLPGRDGRPEMPLSTSGVPDRDGWWLIEDASVEGWIPAEDRVLADGTDDERDSRFETDEDG